MKSEKSQPEESQSSPMNILVVGDWVIDDDWFVGSNHSRTSSVPPNAHFRSLIGRERLHLGVCGAGRVIRPLLHHQPDDDSVAFKILGVGLWAIEDDDYIKALLLDKRNVRDSDLGKQFTHYTLGVGESAIQKDGAGPLSLMNLAKALNSVDGGAAKYLKDQCRCDEETESAFTTSRVVRVFERDTRSGRPRLARRFDWDRPIPGLQKASDCRAWPLQNEYRTAVQKKLEKKLKAVYGEEEVIDAVIVKCLARGVMTGAFAQCLIAAINNHNELAKNPGRVDWFVSSKILFPDWLDEIRDNALHHLKCLLISSIPLRNSNRVEEWFVKGRDGEGKPADCLSRDAFEYVKTILERLQAPKKGDILILQPKGLSTIALSHNSRAVQPLRHLDKWSGVCRKRDSDSTDVGSSSVFFAAACRVILHSPALPTKSNIDVLRDLVTECSATTASWQRRVEARIEGKLTDVQRTELENDEIRKVREDIVSDPGNKQLKSKLNQIEKTQLNTEKKNKEIEDRKRLHIYSQVRDIDWVKASKRWDDAVAGIIHGDSGEKRIELWRGASALAQFVAVSPAKRRSVADVLQLARKFTQRSKEGRSVNQSCLVIAPPGSGKTRLVRGLAKSTGMEFLPFNITELYNRTDLLSCFEQIARRQTELAERRANDETDDTPLLVFFDEINARVDGHHVHDRFLAPLEDSYFSRDGNRSILKPCLWVFADTEDPRKLEEAQKIPDFCSRLTDGFIELGKSNAVECLYIGLLCIKSRFPHVRYVQKGIVDLFLDLASIHSMRDLRHLVESMRDDQGGDEVSFRNLPVNIEVREPGTLIDKLPRWRREYEEKHQPEQERIKVVF